MFLIDKPYISKFLIQTIRDNNFNVIATKSAKELVNDESLSWISEDKAISIIKNNPETPIYAVSENALSWITNNLGKLKLSSQIQLLKDKANFRELIRTSFPDFFFRTVKLEDIQNLSIEDLPFPFVIKPTVGFFSIGVHIVKSKQDWNIAKNELNIDNLKSIFPSDVLNTSTFIIEEFIEGDEYAIDYYHNNKGEVVILNILHHMFTSGTDTIDRVYSTSKDIINNFKEDIENFLNSIGKNIGLKNFPAHAEIRIDADKKITPIEINPLRFGGWCTTGDLSGIALGFNSYECFFTNQKPDWDQIYKNKTGKKYSLVVLNNNSGIVPEKIKQFNYNLLAQDFENPLVVRELDIKQYPVFGFLFTETSLGNEEELKNILVSDLKKYITEV